MIPDTRIGASPRNMDSSTCSDSHFSLAHALELDVRRELLARDDWRFHSLVVHRMKDGICLQGVLECDAPEAKDDVCDLVRQIAGCTDILDHLVVQVRNRPVPKG